MSKSYFFENLASISRILITSVHTKKTKINQKHFSFVYVFVQVGQKCLRSSKIFARLLSVNNKWGFLSFCNQLLECTEVINEMTIIVITMFFYCAREVNFTNTPLNKKHEMRERVKFVIKESRRCRNTRLLLVETIFVSCITTMRDHSKNVGRYFVMSFSFYWNHFYWNNRWNQGMFLPKTTW